MTLTFALKDKAHKGATDLYIVCNDPQGPVRIVRIKAE